MNKPTIHRRSTHFGQRGLALLLSLLASQAVFADGAVNAFQMLAFTDQYHGRLIVSGRYDAARDKLESREHVRDRFAVSNNLCVARAKTADLEGAQQACAEALEERSDVVTPAKRHYAFEQREHMREKAIALSNRGVLRAIAGDEDGARRDFEEALRFDPRLDEIQENLDVLEARAYVAVN